MALPVQTDIVTMDYLFFGMPFVGVPSKDAVDTAGMDYLFFGMPFVTNDGFTAAGASSIKTALGLNKADIKTGIGIAIAGIKSMVGISNV